ncbi:hypothetical protein GCM10023194_81260 [Planotetraspora phitsanulokensis]|uniref:Uncharacterized protein n=1 Tax=Planotetraspora phitsanulokensis TaxID=575192 RepID=A0A8J3XK95_9ACTN|nr:hypothetical protein [Planotetraspora phitsanulokensis]GII42891.1 hypothetical protein Pph01_78940 [Planotetraspora phitsanulokensis]
MTATLAAPAADTRSIAEHLLETLRMLDRARDQTLARDPGAYGHVREALVEVLRTQDWGRAMAEEAILHAMLEGCSMYDAMIATR